MRQLTFDQLRDLRLEGLARALKEQLSTPNVHELTFEERFELLIDAEAADRAEKRLTTRLKKAALRQSARLEDLDHRAARSLDRSLLDSLACCRWLRESRNVIIVGPTGVGKTYLGSALTHKACQEGFSARYLEPRGCYRIWRSPEPTAPTRTSWPRWQGSIS